jgi:hypothetical protein
MALLKDDDTIFTYRIVTSTHASLLNPCWPSHALGSSSVARLGARVAGMGSQEECVCFCIVLAS